MFCDSLYDLYSSVNQQAQNTDYQKPNTQWLSSHGTLKTPLLIPEHSDITWPEMFPSLSLHLRRPRERDASSASLLPTPDMYSLSKCPLNYKNQYSFLLSFLSFFLFFSSSSPLLHLKVTFVKFVLHFWRNRYKCWPFGIGAKCAK